MILREINAQLLLEWLPKYGSIGTVERKWAWFRKNNSDERTLLPFKRPLYLYRGLNRRYSPAVPALYRGINFNEKSLDAVPTPELSQLVVRRARVKWFCKELERHPFVSWMESENIFVDKVALAQHYGVHTGCLDLSESLEVSIFFACCRFDKRSGSYTACTDGRGILYRIKLESFSHEADSPSFPRGRARPIGMQPLSRPYEQWAWALEMRPGEDLELFPGLEAVEFEHSAEVGRHIIDMFNEGKDILPPDCLSDWANRINKRGAVTLPRALALEVLRETRRDEVDWSQGEVGRQLEIIAEQTGITFVDEEESIGKPEELRALVEKWKTEKSAFLDSLEKDTQIILARNRE